MDDPESKTTGASSRAAHDSRLDSWKKIASYLKRDVSTVQRWERREGMPVHRHLHDKQGSVFAFRSELDAWWNTRLAGLATAADGLSHPPPPAPETGLRRQWPSNMLRLAIAAAFFVIVGALAWFAVKTEYFWRSPLADAKFTRLSDLPGTGEQAAISRDGRFVAFLADRNGKVDAWVGEVGSNDYRNLTNGELPELVNPSIRTLGFSVDSTLVSVWTRRPDGSKPGDVKILAAPTAGGALRPYLDEAAEYDWSHDRQRLVYHTTAPGDPLFVREPGKLGNAGDRRIYVAPAGVHCHFPVWSPDDAFVYFVRGVPPDDWDVWRIRPSGAALERITHHDARVTYPVILDSRTLIYLATDADGLGPWMYAVDVERRLPHRVGSGLESYTSLAGSADGNRLVATIANSRTAVWHLSLGLDPAVGVATTAPSPVSTNAAMPRFGADRLLYVTWRGNRQGVWSLKNGAARELWSSAHARISGAPAIDPDGRRIAFATIEEGKSSLYIMNFDGSNPKILIDSLALRGNPAWTPDGRGVVIAVERDGEPRLTRIYLNGEPPQPLVSEYSIDPVWSPDGQFLVYSGADVGTTFPLRAAAADGRPRSLPSVMLTRGARRVAFFRDAQTLLILGGSVDHKNFWLVDLRTGAQRLLAELPPEFVVRDFDLSAVSSEIVFERLQVISDVALIERSH